MNPKISIIVPIYNVEKYLSNCIESILNQTFKDFELILINDGSTDSCKEICENYEKKDFRVKFINKENGGVASARNVGINIAEGEYLAFVDPDDDIEKNMYELLFNSIKEMEVDVVVCSFKYIDFINNRVINQEVYDKVNSKITKNEIYTKILPKLLSHEKSYAMYSIFNKLYKKKLFDKFNISFDESLNYGEDLKVNLTLLTLLNSISFINEPLYNYYIRKRNSLTQMFRENFYENILKEKNFYKYLTSKHNYENLINYIDNHYMNLTFQYMINICNHNVNLNKKNNILKNIMNNNDFKNTLNNYKCPYRYYKLLKFFSLRRYSLIFIALAKVLNLKESLK